VRGLKHAIDTACVHGCELASRLGKSQSIEWVTSRLRTENHTYTFTDTST